MRLPLPWFCLLAVWVLAANAFCATQASDPAPKAAALGDVLGRYDPAPFGRPKLMSFMIDQRLEEFSGLAASRLRADRFWAVNDGGQAAELLQLTLQGKVQKVISLAPIANIDFEAMASFRWKNRPKGRAYIAVADIGDNAAVRGDYVVHVFHERSLAQPNVKESWQVRFRYPDGAHDCEAFAVDARAGYFYMASKRVTPSILYRIPIRPSANQLDRSGRVTAERVAPLQHLQADNPQAAAQDNQLRYAAQPTGMTLSCDGKELLLLTYAAVYRYVRTDTQSWQQALAGQRPSRVLLPPMLQAETIELSNDCQQLFVGSEKNPAPFFRYMRKGTEEIP